MRLLRLLINAATALSVLLATAAAFMWVRGQSTLDHLTIKHGTPDEVGTYQVHLGGGRVWVTWRYFPSFSNDDARGIRWGGWKREKAAASEPYLRFWTQGQYHYLYSVQGFALYRITNHNPAIDGPSPHPTGVAQAPYWFVLLLFLAVPLIRGTARFGSALGKRQSARRNCRNCGYDLRATPNRCPECGTTHTAHPQS
jgi:hypothetical protein